jgi:glucokinase
MALRRDQAPRSAADVGDIPMKTIGIDIGGTKIAMGAVDQDGKVVLRMALPTDARLGFENAVGRICRAIDSVLSQAGWRSGELAGIGIGCAGPVDPALGLINNPHTLSGWDGCDIVSPLRERFAVPVHLENDADAALIGESWIGAGRNCDPVVMLTFGTGVGGAAMIGNRIVRGANGEHPEMGHVAVTADGPECYCGIRGCLESMASGRALAKAGSAGGYPDPEAVFDAAEKGESGAKRIAERALDAAATAAWTFFHSFLPQRLILGGGLMERLHGPFAAAMNRRLQAASQFAHSSSAIVPGALGNDAGLIGAARLCHPSEPPTQNIT